MAKRFQNTATAAVAQQNYEKEDLPKVQASLEDKIREVLSIELDSIMEDLSKPTYRFVYEDLLEFALVEEYDEKIGRDALEIMVDDLVSEAI